MSTLNLPRHVQQHGCKLPRSEHRVCDDSAGIIKCACCTWGMYLVLSCLCDSCSNACGKPAVKRTRNVTYTARVIAESLRLLALRRFTTQQDTACHTYKAGRQPACRQWARCCAVSKTRQGDGRQTAEVQGYRGWGSGRRIQSLLQSGRPALDLNHLVVVPAEQAAWWSENKLRTETARAPPHLTPELCSPAPLGRAQTRSRRHARAACTSCHSGFWHALTSILRHCESLQGLKPWTLCLHPPPCRSNHSHIVRSLPTVSPEIFCM